MLDVIRGEHSLSRWDSVCGPTSSTWSRVRNTVGTQPFERECIALDSEPMNVSWRASAESIGVAWTRMPGAVACSSRPNGSSA